MKKALLASLIAVAAFGQARSQRYVVLLKDAPVLEATAQAGAAARPAYRQRLVDKQATLRHELEGRKVRVSGSVQTLANAVFVTASPSDIAAIAQLPEVQRVVPDMPLKRHLSAALDLVKATTAWSTVGGQQNAGRGIKIAIMDTGLDQTHPGLQDTSLGAPPAYQGRSYPMGDTGYTNNKIVVARSYVEQLVYFGSNDPRDWRADDTSPRDRVGHGTAAAMIAAGNSVFSPLGNISGVAPKAYLGNYKIFGSTGVNDTTWDSVVLQALDDAYNDGMDVALLSLGSPALWSPSSSGTVCGEANGVLCDYRVRAVESAVSRGMVVVASAGNSGALGTRSAAGSIETPGSAPSAITVGASSNSRTVYQTVTANGRTINALFGNGPRPGGPITAKLIAAGNVGDQYGCSAFPANSLAGAIVIIQRGNCYRDAKINNAQAAGAIAVILYQDQGDSLFISQDLASTSIPALLVGNADGNTLRGFANGTNTATLNPAFVSSPATGDVVTTFSSQGPTIGTLSIKPEVVAPGANVYTATQKTDPSGDTYDPSGFTAVQGTSYAAAFAAGTAALVKQNNPGMTALQIKSAVVNTADGGVTYQNTSGQSSTASVFATGAGRLNAANAVRTNVTAVPSTLSFGLVSQPPFTNQNFTLRNHGSQPVTLSFSVQPNGGDPGNTQIAPTPTVSLPPGGTANVSLRLAAINRINAGSYEGILVISGGTVPLRVPYAYIATDNTPANFVPLQGFDFLREAGTPITLSLRALDQFGVGLNGVAIRFAPSQGDGRIVSAYATTDDLGFIGTRNTDGSGAFVGNQIGNQAFEAALLNNPSSGPRLTFAGRVRALPVVASRGVTNAASNEVADDKGIAPGSYISIYGTSLTESTQYLYTTFLPYSMLGVSVSFDVPSANKSFPGRFQFAGPGQINVQVPWELAGYSDVQLKVSMGLTSAASYSLRVAPAAPGLFEQTDASGQVIAAAQAAGGIPIRQSRPARVGETIVLYANGLGPVSNTPNTGEASPGSTLARTTQPVTVTIGGQNAPVSFSGLTPGSIGLYQINVTVPQVGGNYQPVVVTANGVSSKTAYLPIQ